MSAACQCNRFGSVRDDCVQTTGRCVCRSHVIVRRTTTTTTTTTTTEEEQQYRYIEKEYIDIAGEALRVYLAALVSLLRRRHVTISRNGL